MTDGQAAFLRDLCERRGETFDPHLTRAQARERIVMLARSEAD